MFSAKAKIRLALVIVASISLGASFLSLFYMNSMVKKIDEIVHRDAKMAELGEGMALKMLKARREEKNFIIYLDPAYIEDNRAIIEDFRTDIDEARQVSQEYTWTLDSLEHFVTHYSRSIDLLVQAFEENPKALNVLQRQVMSYEDQLKKLAHTGQIETDSLPSWMSDLNISLLAASTKLSAEKARLFTELRESSDLVLKSTQGITERARQALAQHSSEGVRYGVKAQRNTITVFLITGFLLAYLVFYLPSRIFLPFRRLVRALKAIGRGETDVNLPGTEQQDEIGELARAFESAIHNLKLFDSLKTKKIAETERKLRRVLDETKDAVLILSPELRISYLNSAASKLFSIKGEVTSKRLQDLPELWAILATHLQNVETRGRVEFVLSGTQLNLPHKHGAVIRNMGRDGKPENILVIMR